MAAHERSTKYNYVCWSPGFGKNYDMLKGVCVCVCLFVCLFVRACVRTYVRKCVHVLTKFISKFTHAHNRYLK